MSHFFVDQQTDDQSAATDWSGGAGTFWVWGTFDGASISLEASPDGSNWFVLGDAVSFTEKGVGAFQLGPCRLRATLTGAGAATNVTARL